MIDKHVLRFESVSLTAVIQGERVTLVDRGGRVLGRSDRLDRLSLLDDRNRLLTEWAWRDAIDRIKTWISTRARSQKQSCNPWQKKVQSLESSFRRRSTEHARPRGRCRFEKYSTQTWEDAVVRLWQQGRNHYRYFSRSGWHGWAYTVANNHNKKMGGRYAKARNRDGQADHGTD